MHMRLKADDKPVESAQSKKRGQAAPVVNSPQTVTGPAPSVRSTRSVCHLVDFSQSSGSVGSATQASKDKEKEMSQILQRTLKKVMRKSQVLLQTLTKAKKKILVPPRALGKVRRKCLILLQALGKARTRSQVLKQAE